MKRLYFLIAGISLFSSSAFCQFESRYHDSSKPQEIDYAALSILNAEVGKEYWIKANPEAMGRITFGSNLGRLGTQNQFVVTSDLKFLVLGWQLDAINSPYFKVQFENGKVAYLPANTSWKSRKQAFYEHVFDGTEYFKWREYLFRSTPDEALSAWQKNVADKKMAEKMRVEAERMRVEAKYQAEQMKAEAERQAEKMKAEAERMRVEAERMRVEAESKAEQMKAEAESKAEQMKAEAESKAEQMKAEAESKAKGGVRIGMTKKEVLKSNWGKPHSINKTTLANGTTEQWVYDFPNYLYFTNGVLTAIHN